MYQQTVYMHDFPLNGKYAASVATNEFDLNFSRHRVILTWYKNHLWHTISLSLSFLYRVNFAIRLGVYVTFLYQQQQKQHY